MTAPLSVLQVTDTHLRAPGTPAPNGRTVLGVDTAHSLCAVLDRALAEGVPDALIASGDLAHDPQEASYRRLEALLSERYGGPVMYVAGNHDLMAPMARVLGSALSLRLGNWEMIGFDSHADDQVEASFDDDRRRDLASRIRASEADHVLLVCHHHPWSIDCPWLDAHCIQGGRELLASCAALAGATGVRVVRGLVFGHVHQEVQETLQGLPVLGTPSTCFQFQPRSRTFAIDRSADSGRPGYRWLTLHADGAIDSRVGRVSEYALNIDLSDRS